MGGLSPGTAHVYPLQRRPSVAHSAVNHSTKLPVRGLGASVPRCRKLHPSPTSFSLCFLLLCLLYKAQKFSSFSYSTGFSAFHPISVTEPLLFHLVLLFSQALLVPQDFSSSLLFIRTVPPPLSLSFRLSLFLFLLFNLFSFFFEAVISLLFQTSAKSSLHFFWTMCLSV